MQDKEKKEFFVPEGHFKMYDTDMFNRKFEKIVSFEYKDKDGKEQYSNKFYMSPWNDISLKIVVSALFEGRNNAIDRIFPVVVDIDKQTFCTYISFFVLTSSDNDDKIVKSMNDKYNEYRKILLEKSVDVDSID